LRYIGAHQTLLVPD